MPKKQNGSTFKKIITGLLILMLLFSTAAYISFHADAEGLGNESSNAGNASDKFVIEKFAGYDVLGEDPYSALSIEDGVPFENLNLPETISVFIAGENQAIDIPVTWELVEGFIYEEHPEDISDADCMLTAILPEEYQLSEELSKGIELDGGRMPWIFLTRTSIDKKDEIQQVQTYALANSEFSGQVWYTATGRRSFDVMGGNAAIKTSYNNGGYDTTIMIDGAYPAGYGKSANQGMKFSANGGTLNIGGIFDVTQTLSFVNDGAYVKIDYAVYNKTQVNHTVSLASHTDVQIGGNDSAPIYITATGVRMAEGTASTANQFNLIAKNAYGVTNVDCLWFGAYGSRFDNLWNTATTDMTGGDSGIAWGWKNRLIPAGGTQHFSVLLGIGKSAAPPQLDGDIKAVVKGNQVDVTAKAKDTNGMVDTLYYVFDMDTDNETAAAKLTAVTADGTWKEMKGVIPKPASWQAGEFHTISVWVMNDASAMSSIKTVPIVISESEGGDVMEEAKAATLTFAPNGGGGSQASMNVYEKQEVKLPACVLTAPSNYKFGGWEDTNGVIYAEATSYMVPAGGMAFKAIWVPSDQQPYYLDVYKEQKDGSDKLVGSRIITGKKIGDSVSMTAAQANETAQIDLTGYELNTSKSVLSGTVGAPSSPLRLKAYYKRSVLSVKFDPQGAPGIAERVVNTKYGEKLSEADLAALTPASSYVEFKGWYMSPNGKGAQVTSDRIIKDNMTVYAYWQMKDSVKITFDYDYKNPRESSLNGKTYVTDLKEKYAEGNHYNLSAYVEIFPDNPAEWQDKDGNSWAFDGWYTEDGQIVDSNAELKPEPVTVTAKWRQVYNVVTSKSGNGSITDARSYEPGQNAVVRWSAYAGYKVTHVIVDGQWRDELINKGQVSFDNIKQNHNVRVIFEEDPKAITKYNIITSGTNTNITQSASVAKGNNFEVNWSVPENYQVSSVIIDGNIRDDLKGQTSYTFENITSDHNIQVICTEIPKTGPATGGDPDKNFFEITTDASNAKTITQGAKVEEGKDYKVEWIALDGYHVAYVLIDGVQHPELINATQYTFKNINAGHNITVVCVENSGGTPASNYYKITATGTDATVSGGGWIKQGELCKIQWTPKEGYRVICVTVDDMVSPELLNKTEYTFANVTANHSINVICVKEEGEPEPVEPIEPDETSYNVITSAVNAVISASAKVKENGDYTVKWQVGEGYHISQVLIDGKLVPELLNKWEYTFKNISKHYEITVIAEADKEETVNPPGGEPAKDEYKISTTCSNATITPSKTLKQGENYTVKCTPQEGYHIATVIIDGIVRADLINDTEYMFVNISADHTVSVICVKNDESGDDPISSEYTITTSAANATVTPTKTVKTGDNHTVEWQASNGYHVAGVIIDDMLHKELTSKTSYTFTGIMANHTVNIICVKDDPAPSSPDSKNFTITTTAKNASISPSKTVALGGSYTVKWQASSGYHITYVIVDGEIQIAESLAKEFVFDKVNSNHSVHVIAEADVQAPGGSEEQDAKYKIETNAINADISSSKTVKEGDSYTVTCTPKKGYHISSIVVDNEMRPELINETEFAFTNIKGNHTISVICEKDDEESVTPPDPEKPTPEKKNYYMINTVSPGASKVELTPTFSVEEGASAKVKWKVKNGYKITRILVDGYALNNDAVSSGEYEFDNIHTDHKVTVYAEAYGNIVPDINEAFYNVSTAASNATIDPSKSVKKGDDYKVAWTVDEGYQVSRILIDGTNHPELFEAGEYTFADIADNHTISVICVKETSTPVDPDKPDPGDVAGLVFINTSIANGPGTITSSAIVNAGKDVPIEWKIEGDERRYKVDSIYIDGEPVEIDGDSYKFEDVTEDHNIDVYLVPNMVNVTVTYEGEGVVSESAYMFCGDEYQMTASASSGWTLYEIYRDDEIIWKEGHAVQRSTRMNILKAANRLLAATPLSARASDSYDSGIEEIEQDTNYHVVFKSADGSQPTGSHRITTRIVGGSGTISSVGSVADGESKNITWTMAAGYEVEYIGIDDGIGMERVIDGNELESILQSGNQYMLEDIYSDITFTVHLKPTVKVSDEGETFDLTTAIVGGAGNITSSAFGLEEGTDKTVEWSTRPGSYITQVVIDGVVSKDALKKGFVDLVMDKDHDVVVYMNSLADGSIKKKAEVVSRDDGKIYAGDIIKYTLTATNNGDHSIWESVYIRDQIPAGLSIKTNSIQLIMPDGSIKPQPASCYDADSRTISVLAGDLHEGEAARLVFQAEVNEKAILPGASNDIGNIAIAEGKNPDDTEEKTKTPEKVYPENPVKPGDVITDVTPLEPDQHIVKKAENLDRDDIVTQVGDTVRYTIELQNNRKGSAWLDVDMNDVLPEGLLMKSGTLHIYGPDGVVENGDNASVSYDEATRTIHAHVKAVYGNNPWKVVFEVTVLPEAATINDGGDILDIGNIAMATGTTPEGNEADDETEKIYPVDNDKPEKGGVVLADPEPNVVKTAKNHNEKADKTLAGDVITYTITAKNQAKNSVWTHAVIRDNLPKGVKPVAGSFRLKKPDGSEIVLADSVYDAQGNLISVFVGDMYGDESYTLTFDAKVMPEAVEAGSDIGNIGLAYGGNPKDHLKPSNPGDYEDEGHKIGDPYFPANDGWLANASENTNSNKTYPLKKDVPDSNNNDVVIGDNVKTGDEMHISMYIGLLVISLAVLILCIWLNRRKSKE